MKKGKKSFSATKTKQGRKSFSVWNDKLKANKATSKFSGLIRFINKESHWTIKIDKIILYYLADKAVEPSLAFIFWLLA